MQQSGRIDSQIGKKLKFEFESSVNSEGIETEKGLFFSVHSLRAV